MLELIKAFRMLSITNKSQSLDMDEEILAGMIENPIQENHGDFLWLLVLDLLIFIGLTIVSYQASLKIAENTQTLEDPNALNKLKFIKGLTYANGSKQLINNLEISTFNNYSKSIITCIDYYTR